MIVERMWTRKTYKFGVAEYRKTWRGWFLFGFIPLYIKMIKLEWYR